MRVQYLAVTGFAQLRAAINTPLLKTRVPDKHLAANAPFFGHISLFIAK